MCYTNNIMESWDRVIKLINLDEKEYEDFVKSNKYKSHFLQSYYWGQFSKEKKNLTNLH